MSFSGKQSMTDVPAAITLPERTPEQPASRRWACSPWWPLLLWLGLPATISNLSIATWQVLQMNLVLNGTFSSGSSAGTDFWSDATQYAMTITMFLLLVQLTLVSLILAWSRGVFWKRFAVYWGCVALILGSLLASVVLSAWLGRWLETINSRGGLFMHDSYTDLTAHDTLRVAASLPMLVLGFQLPFWAVRIVFGWHLRCRGENEVDADSERRRNALSIRDLLAATAIVAISLALLQWADQLSVQSEQAEAMTYLFIVLCASAACAMIGSVIALPLSALFLSGVRLSISWSASLCLALACSGMLTAIAWWLGSVNEPWENLLIGLCGCIPFFVAYPLSLLVLRLYGWRLDRPSKYSRPSPLTTVS